MERHFTEEQVAEIIRRAAAYQNRAKTPGVSTPAGISESELCRVAEELGIDAEAFRRSLDEVGASTQNDTGTLNSVSRVLERTIQGEVPEDAYGAMVEEFVPVSGFGGQSILQIGKALSYSCMVGVAQCNVNVSRRDRQTVLRVQSNATMAGLAAFLPAFLATAVSGAIVWDQMTAAAAVKLVVHLSILALIWSGATVGFRAMVRNANRKVRGMIDRAAAKLAEATGRLDDPLTQTADLQTVSPDEERHIQLP
jgi:uncharacterized membrane protein